MMRNGSGLERARKSRFSEMRKSAPTRSVRLRRTPMRASAGFRPRLRYDAKSPNGTASSSSIKQPIARQNSWQRFNLGALRFRPISSTTILSTNRLTTPAWSASWRINVLQSGRPGVPKVYMYSLLSRTRRKAFFEQFVACFFDSRHDLGCGQPVQRRLMRSIVGQRLFDNLPRRHWIWRPSVSSIVLPPAHRDGFHDNTILNPPGRVKNLRIGGSEENKLFCGCACCP